MKIFLTEPYILNLEALDEKSRGHRGLVSMDKYFSTQTIDGTVEQIADKMFFDLSLIARLA